MSINMRILFLLFSIAGWTLPALAEDGALALGATAGTLGFGPEVAWRFHENWAVRGNATFFSYDETVEVDDIDYDGELDLNSFGATLDWFPTGGGFRVSLGARANGNEIGVRSNLATDETVNLGDTEYTGEELGELTGTVTTDDFGPYLAIGYGGQLAPGFVLGFELGVMYQGSPTVDELRSVGGTLSDDPQLQSDLDAEARRIEDETSNFEYWPILQLSLAYRF